MVARSEFVVGRIDDAESIHDKAVRVQVGFSGCVVAVHTPVSSFCIGMGCWLMPLTATDVALGALKRNVTVLSAPTSGDRTAGAATGLARRQIVGNGTLSIRVRHRPEHTWGLAILLLRMNAAMIAGTHGGVYCRIISGRGQTPWLADRVARCASTPGRRRC